MIFDERALEELLRRVVREELDAGTSTNEDTFLSVAASAKLADVSPGWIRGEISAGRLQRCQAGRELRVRRSDLERLLSSPAPDDSTNQSPEALARSAVAAEYANSTRRNGRT